MSTEARTAKALDEQSMHLQASLTSNSPIHRAIYCRGWQARRASESEGHCPYGRGGKQHAGFRNAWLSGWAGAGC